MRGPLCGGVLVAVLGSSAPAVAMTVTFQAGDGSGFSITDDAYLVEQGRYSRDNFNGEEFLFIDEEDDDFDSTELRALIRFSEAFGDQIGQVGEDAIIELATLEVWTEGGGALVEVYGINEGWDVDSVSWENRRTDQPWSSEGVGPPSSTSDPVTSFNAAEEGSHSIDLTSLVRTWTDDPDDNHGI